MKIVGSYMKLDQMATEIKSIEERSNNINVPNGWKIR